MIMIDCDFPGGNIIAERIDGDDVFVRQDLRDTNPELARVFGRDLAAALKVYLETSVW